MGAGASVRSADPPLREAGFATEGSRMSVLSVLSVRASRGSEARIPPRSRSVLVAAYHGPRLAVLVPYDDRMEEAASTRAELAAWPS
jgi:hypothetical protein